MKQFLTLMLAFVMVFTGMGIGSWGVDEAWADNSDNLQSIRIEEDIIKQNPIGTCKIDPLNKGHSYSVYLIKISNVIDTIRLIKDDSGNNWYAYAGISINKANVCREKDIVRDGDVYNIAKNAYTENKKNFDLNSFYIENP